jgi:RNA polymerase sigma factor (sigma-70 family)
MSDSELVASIVAGNPDGLAAAYDKYAGDLYGYCQSLLQDPNDAADAVQDTFVIAASKLAGLRDPQRLRSWLFAVARNECLHRLKSRRAAAPLHDVPEPVDDSVDIASAAERAETVALVRAAVGGLNAGERDVINQLWHGLDVPEVAAVLGVSRNHAYALFSRARDQLEASVGVLLVGRTGRRDCATLDSLLGDWDGRLTALLRKRVGRHIDRCPVCSDRRRQELSPALLYDLSATPLLALVALHGGTALAAVSRLTGVRDALLRLTADPAAHAAAFRAATARSTHSFGMTGFPKAPHHGYLGLARPPHLPFAVTGGTAITATAAVVVTATAAHLHPARPPGGPAPGAAAPSAAPAVRITRGGGPSLATPAEHGVTASATGAPAWAHPAARGRPTGAPATGTGGGPTRPVSTVTRPASGTAVSTPTTGTGTSATGLPSAGILSVSPTTVVLSPLLGGTLTLTASGGPVSWSISAPGSLLGKLTVTPASGTLDAGGSTTVTITVAGLVSLDTQLTVQSGGQLATVLLRLG